MEKIKDVITWFEIPVLNFERAKGFYERILDSEMHEMMMGPNRMGFLPMDMDAQGVGGAIVQGDGYIPSSMGTKVYLNGGKDLSAVLSRIEPAGGTVLQKKTKITDEIGFYAIFEDTEGNHIRLHSRE